MAYIEGCLLTFLGTAPSISQAMFTSFNASMTTTFGMSAMGTPQYQTAGSVTTASAMYTAALVQALVRVNETATLSLYLNILWYGVPDMEAFKAMVRTTFNWAPTTIIENPVRLEI